MDRHRRDVRFVPKADIGSAHSITSSASIENESWIVGPSALAFVMLMASSNRMRRGPLTAAALAGLGLWMLLPQLTARIVPLS
jgi:hypothetical protein